MTKKAGKPDKQTLLAKLLYGLATVAVFGSVLVSGAIFYYSHDLPDHRTLEEYYPKTTTRLYTADGRLLTEYAREKRIYVPIDAMPKVLINAFLAAEDRSFYSNAGIDIFGIIRAAFQNVGNIMQGSERLVGASTITQQVAKNILLSNERTFSRKIKEAIIAFRMSITLSKDRILELYLNEIYLGAGSYGVAAASLNYFNKSVDELTVEEAALLAALPKAPSVFDPRKNYKRTRDRRDWVIQGMLEEGYITTAQARFARSEPIRLKTGDNPNSIDASFFSEEIRRWLEKEYGGNVLYEGGLVVRTTLDPKLQKIAEDALRDGVIDFDRRHGFHGKITKIDIDNNWVKKLEDVEAPDGASAWGIAVVLEVGNETVQIGLKNGNTGFIKLSALKWAQKSLDGFWKTSSQVLSEGDVISVERLKKDSNEYGLRQAPKVNGAIIAMDPHTGRVLAMVGGYTSEGTQFNRATQARRQPGSAFKPFVYMTALQNGFTPAMLILDEPIEFETYKPRKQQSKQEETEEDDSELSFEEKIMKAVLARNKKNANEPEIEVWAPQNYSGDFYGPTTLRVGLEKSRNVMTVRLGLALGIDKVIETSRKFGIYENPEKNMSTVLGAAETTLEKLTNAYAMVVNGGKRVTPSLVERIHDRSGKIIYRRDSRECYGCVTNSSEDIVSLTPPILEDDREVVVDPYTAYQLTSMLEGVVQRGTGIRAKSVGKPLGGKTGTTNNSVDAWFVGFSPDLVVGVYIGYDQPRSLGERETGSSVALPVFEEFMKGALKDNPSTPFRIPSGIKLVKIDMKTGFLPTEDTPSSDIILEAFKPGTEPEIALRRNESLPILDSVKSLEDNPDWFEDMKIMDKPVTRGTGGIY